MIEMFKALGDENRLRILNLLMGAELCVCEIEVLLDITQSNASRHLNKLKSSQIITSYKDAQWVHYQVSEYFVEGHKELYEYLIGKLKTLDVCLKDNKRYHKYVTKEMDCTWIKEDKEKVLELLK